MKRSPLALAPSALAVLALATPAGAQAMYVEGCNLGCSSGAGGNPVTCSVADIHVDEDLRVRFSQPVDLFSVNALSFRIVDVANGTTAIGMFFVEPADPHVLVFRPQVSFDQSGNVVYGLKANTAYQIVLPGRAQGDAPPYVRSVDGVANESRMDCTVITSLGEAGPIRTYCTAAPNSAGAGAHLGWTGTSSVAADDLVLEVSGAVPQQFGMFLMSIGQTEVPAGDGFLCVGGTLHRLPPILLVDAAGTASRPLDLDHLPPAVGDVAVGSVWTFQFVYRDAPAGGSGWNFSDGLKVLFLP